MNEKLLEQLIDADNVIRQCIAWANGRQYEWGERAENAFQFLENYENKYPTVPLKEESYEYYPLDNSESSTMVD
jgi:hypothetical protein